MNRTGVRLAAAASATCLALAGCSSSGQGEVSDRTSDGGTVANQQDARASLLERAPVADPEDIPEGSLRDAHERGALHYGGSDTQKLFSVKNPVTGELEGFDATMALLLAKYLTGEPSVEQTIATTATREGLLQNGTVDVVIYTYGFVPARDDLVDFAGPYFNSGQTLALRADDPDTDHITSVEDLDGYSVCTTKGNDIIPLLEEGAPGVSIVTVDTSGECEQMLRQGRVDAQAQQQPILLGQVEQGGMRLFDEILDPSPYYIGVPNTSPETIEFLNEWIDLIIEEGIFDEAYEDTFGHIEGANVEQAYPVSEG